MGRKSACGENWGGGFGRGVVALLDLSDLGVN